MTFNQCCGSGSANKIIITFVKFVATKNGLAKKDFSRLSFVAVFGSGMAKNQDPGSGINIPDPQHWLFSQMFSHKPGEGGRRHLMQNSKTSGGC